MTTYQIIAEEPFAITRKLYNRLGTYMQQASVTLPAGRVVGNWPTQFLADRHAAKMRKRYQQRFTVRSSDKSYKPRIHTQ